MYGSFRASGKRESVRRGESSRPSDSKMNKRKTPKMKKSEVFMMDKRKPKKNKKKNK